MRLFPVRPDLHSWLLRPEGFTTNVLCSSTPRAMRSVADVSSSIAMCRADNLRISDTGMRRENGRNNSRCQSDMCGRSV
jgi:hypothetical protein